MSRICPQCRSRFEPTKERQWWCCRKCYCEAFHGANQARFRKQQAAYHAAMRERVARHKAALASRKRARQKAFLAKWSKVDWSKQNCELADEIGLTTERIRQIRQLIGAMQPKHPSRRRKIAATLQRAKDNLDEIKGLSAAEVERKYALSRSWRNGPLHRFLKPFLKNGRFIRKHPWNLMDFGLLNCDLERIWKLPFNMAGAYRYRKRLPLQTWRCKPGTTDILCTNPGQFETYQRTKMVEEQKAAKYFAQT